ncbi:MAG: hypothetical protein H6574_20090 [Lewinellaceae bacterium]|nr:hypothetical protein [Lewinellaceae bacterium]
MQTKHNVHATWLLSAAFSLLFTLPLSAQKTAAKPENQPEYPGGMPALIDYMVQNIKYPEAAKKNRLPAWYWFVLLWKRMAIFPV